MSPQHRTIEKHADFEHRRPFKSAEDAQEALTREWDALIKDLPDGNRKTLFSRKRTQLRQRQTKEQLSSTDVREMQDVTNVIKGVETTWQSKHGAVSERSPERSFSAFPMTFAHSVIMKASQNPPFQKVKHKHQGSVPRCFRASYL